MDESDTSLILDGRITSIELNIATPKEIKGSSANDCPISHSSQLVNPFLGLPVESGKCESCGTSEPGKCEGHFGYIELPIPVYHPSHVSELRSILNLVCLKCLKLKKGKVRFELGRNSLTDSSSCSHCKDLPPISVKEVKNSDGIISLELKVPSRGRLKPGFWSFLKKYGFPYGDQFRRPLLACEVLEVLKRIPVDTKRKLAGKGHFPQCGYVLQSLPIPPNCLLVPDISDGKSIISNDISVSLLRKILNKIDIIKKSRSGSPNFESYEVESSELQTAITQYFHLRGARRTSQDVTRKLPLTEASNLSAKQWLEKMRSLFISKGSSYTSRSVLTGDAYRGTQEIGIPSEIAKKMTFEERVTEWNIRYLQGLVDSRQCLKYGDGSSTYSTEEGSRAYTSLKIGQIVSRRIMDGDLVFVNRPPTTHKHALQAFSVYIHDDHTIKINPLICAPFGADFDGDCVHIFYPQSLAAKAEVRELFSVEQQLCSSHSGTFNIQLVNDSLLALKLMCRTSFLKRSTVQQLAMFTSYSLPSPSLIKASSSGPLWTILQILESTLPGLIDSFGEKILIRNGEILKLEFSKDTLHHVLGEVAMSILLGKGPKEALKFINTLQPLLMEIVYLEGFSISLADFYIPENVVDDIRKSLQEITCLLHQLRCSYNELIDLEVENRLKISRVPIKDFILGRSSFGYLIDAKSESSIFKLVQQVGFVGPQLFTRGKLYSRLLVDDIFSNYVKKFSTDTGNHLSEAYGLVRSSFSRGLNPYEELIHSLSTREIIVRSSRGLAEPGTLFKNLMAVLRDVAICYDGTARNMCSNSIVQFKYGCSSSFAPPGEPVGVLAATAISKPAYAAVLDSSQSTNLSWDLMKEILLSRVAFKNDVRSRQVTLYLEDCCCAKLFCKEKAAILVQSCLRKVTLKECAINFSIRYENQFILHDGTEMIPCLVGHIHLDKERLNRLNCTVTEILQKCEEAINLHRKKRSQCSHIFRRVALSASEKCICTQPCDAVSQFPCLQFSYYDKDLSGCVDLEKTIFMMANAVCPVLLDAVIKGDPRVNSVNITWLSPESTTWVKNSRKAYKGEVAVEVVIEKAAVKQSTDAWSILMDACLPVIHLIDIKRSVPCGIQQIQGLFGISASFNVAIQRLSAAVGTVTKGVLNEHLILVAHSMTCTGNFIGFNASGYKALFRSLNVQVPFTEATLLTPMKCFERAAERCHTDSLSSVVASSLWGKNVSVGTGAHFEIVWNSSQDHHHTIGNNVYEFLHMVTPTTCELKTTSCLGEDIEEFEEEEIPSPEHDALFGNLTFDDPDDFRLLHDNNKMTDEGNGGSVWKKAKSSWEKASVMGGAVDGWGSKDDWSRSTREVENQDNQFAKISERSSAWEKLPLHNEDKLLNKDAQLESSSWKKATFPSENSCADRSNNFNNDKKGWENVSSSTAVFNGWGSDNNKHSQWEKASDESSSWEKPKLSAANNGLSNESMQNERSSWQNIVASSRKSPGWGKEVQSNNLDEGKGLGWGSRQNDTSSEPSVWDKPTSSNVESKVGLRSWDEIQARPAMVADDKTRSWDDNQAPKMKSPINQHLAGLVSWNPDAAPSTVDSNAKIRSWDGIQAGPAEVSDNKIRSWDEIQAPKMKSPRNQHESGSGSWEPEAAKSHNVNSPACDFKNASNWKSQGGQNPKLPKQNSWDETEAGQKSSWSQNQTPTAKPNNTKWKADGWGKRSVDRSTGNNSRGMRPGASGSEPWSAEEKKILIDMEPIVQSIRQIRSSYNNGDRLSEDDQKFILEKVFDHHPNKNEKLSGEVDHFKVDEPEEFPGSRCFFVVSSDGSSTDFSYVKCLENFIKKTYEGGDTFCERYFRNRRRTHTPRPHGHPSTPVDNIDTPSQSHGFPATPVDSMDQPNS